MKPVEDQALAGIQDVGKSNQVGLDAGIAANGVYDTTSGMEERQLARFGVGYDSDRQRTIDRRRGLDRALSVAGSTNTARQSTNDVQTSLAGDALQIGRGIAGQSAQTLSQASDIQAARENAARQAAAAKSVGTTNSIFGGAGLGAALGGASGLFGFAAGTTGAALAGGGLGAGLGLLASFL